MTTAPPVAAEAPPSPKKSLAELQQAAGKAIGEAYATGDAKKYAALFTENATVKTAGAPDATGRDAIREIDDDVRVGVLQGEDGRVTRLRER